MKITQIFIILLFLSCGQKENKGSLEKTDTIQSITNDTILPKVTFYKVKAKAVLLGDNIQLLDENLKVVKDISFLNEQLVEVIEVSDKYYKENPSDGYCKEFKYVKIKAKDIEGYVDGRKLYELGKHNQNKIVKIGNNEISFILTTYFGIGVADEDGLTGCSINTPVIFSDKTAKYEGLVKMVKNKNYEGNYPYFELKEDDGANDKIESVDKQDDKYLLKIKRTYQEGGANILVSIYKDKNDVFVAEIIENERTEE